jgi:tRNA-dihydrouridine synthase B
MLGRAAYGRPWWPGALAENLEAGSGRAVPTLSEEQDIALWHQQETLSLYGGALGNKTFRKHLGWLLMRLCERGLVSQEQLGTNRADLLSNADNRAVTSRIRAIFAALINENPLQAAACHAESAGGIE